MQRAADREPDGARVGQPLLTVAVHEAVALRAGVVLVDHRSEPLDHLLLHGHRARRRGVDDALQRRDVVALADIGRQLEQAHEHRRHDLAVGDPVRSTRRRYSSGVEVLHHHDGRPEADRRHAEAQRSGVVQRGRRQVHACPRDIPNSSCSSPSTGAARRLQRLGDERPGDALGQAGGARRVQHVGAGDAVGQRARGLGGDGLLVAVVARRSRRRASASVVTPGVRRAHLGRLVGLVLRRDEDLRPAVAEDVRQLAARQSRRRRGVDRSRRSGNPTPPRGSGGGSPCRTPRGHRVARRRPAAGVTGGWRRRRARRRSAPRRIRP